MVFWRVRLTIFTEDEEYDYSKETTQEDMFFGSMEEAMAYVIDQGKCLDLRNIEIKKCYMAIWKTQYTLNGGTKNDN